MPSLPNLRQIECDESKYKTFMMCSSFLDCNYPLRNSLCIFILYQRRMSQPSEKTKKMFVLFTTMYLNNFLLFLLFQNNKSQQIKCKSKYENPTIFHEVILVCSFCLWKVVVFLKNVLLMLMLIFVTFLLLWRYNMTKTTY